MGLWSATKSLFSGKPDEAFDQLYVDEETIAAGNASDRANDDLNRKNWESGKVTEQEYRASLARITNNAFPDFVNSDGEHGRLYEQPGTNPSAGFAEGLGDGARNIRTTVSDAINGTVGFTFKLVPWQLWAVLGIYLAFITLPYWAPGFAGKMKLGKK